MLSAPKRLLQRLVHRTGYDIVPRPDGCPPDFDPATRAVIRRVAPYTMTTPEAVFALCNSVEYIVRAGIPGAIVECGVWKGGSMMAIALTLLRCGITDRKLYLFDTFEGMTEPSDVDVDLRGQSAARLMANSKRDSLIWAYAPLEQVKQVIHDTGYDPDNLVIVQGKVEDTLPEAAPAQIALLRLDTDWYESTYHELVHLFPNLVQGGALIMDDYGHWQGARQAIDRYIAERQLRLCLQRVDYTTRVAVKVDP
jgi:O-methyltransferase